MDHVIKALTEWLEVYRERDAEDRDKKAERCIENAIDELYKYYGK